MHRRNAYTYTYTGPWPPPRTSHAGAVAGSGSSASLVICGGQDGSLGSAAAAILADAWVLSPLGSAHRSWSRLDWSGTTSYFLPLTSYLLPLASYLLPLTSDF